MTPVAPVPAPTDGERFVTLVLCDPTGAVLGQLEPFTARPQFWPEVDDVVARAREVHGIAVTILRLLTTQEPYAGGAGSYLAQLGPEVPSVLSARLNPPSPVVAAASRSDARHRLWWAEVGGLDGLADWVDDALAATGRSRTGPLRQRKTWNLSCVVTMPTSAGTVWFKAVPPFLADEGAVVGRVAAVDPELPPRLLAHDAGRRAILMDHAPGDDQWGLADGTVIDSMVGRWVTAQAALVDDIEHALSVGAMDRRGPALVDAVRRTVTVPATRAALSTAELVALDRLVDALPARMARLSGSGMPDTLLHGDLHPGNWRRDGSRLTLLDWGDAGVGSPALDMRAFLERLPGPTLRHRARDQWVRAWRRHAPGCDPRAALGVVGPVAELLAASTYQRFLDSIEVTERVYHHLDPVDRLRAALAADRTGASLP